MMTDMAMNSIINARIMKTWVFSVMFLMKLSLRKSKVSVELEAMTRDDSVDMDADSTSNTTRPIRTSGRPDNMAGMMASKPSVSTFT